MMTGGKPLRASTDVAVRLGMAAVKDGRRRRLVQNILLCCADINLDPVAESQTDVLHHVDK